MIRTKKSHHSRRLKDLVESNIFTLTVMLLSFRLNNFEYVSIVSLFGWNINPPTKLPRYFSFFLPTQPSR